MPDALKHQDADKKDDATLAQDAASYLAKAPALQLLAELLGELRGRQLSWWTPDGLRTRYAASSRMRWLHERADVRQQITTALTGLLPKAARKKDPDFQAGLLDAAIDDGDVTSKQFEDAFDVRDIAVYGPAGDYWRQFRQRMPWGQDVAAHQEVVAFLLKMLLVDKGALGLARKPILTPWDVRSAISSRVWHTRLPVDVRAAIDDARFEREKKTPRDPFQAKDDLAIATPDVMAANIPIKEFGRVLDVAERAMGFEAPTPEVGSEAPPATWSMVPEGAAGASAPSGAPGAPSIRPGAASGAVTASTAPGTMASTSPGAMGSTSPGLTLAAAQAATVSIAAGAGLPVAPNGGPSVPAATTSSTTPGASQGPVRESGPPALRGLPRPPPLRGVMQTAPFDPAAAADANIEGGTPTPVPPAMGEGAARDDGDVLFDVDLSSSEDVVMALDRMEGPGSR